MSAGVEPAHPVPHTKVLSPWHMVLWTELCPCPSPPSSHAEAPPPNMMVLAGGFFGRRFGSDEVIRVGPSAWD